jgi:uncharacterized protein (TIGR02452 family)
MSDAREQRRITAAATLATITNGFYEGTDGASIDVADAIRSCAEKTSYYRPSHVHAAPTHASHDVPTTLDVVHAGTLCCSRRLVASGHRVVALNFASARNPGGGFLNGAEAQEENIARHSALYAALTSPVGRQFYALADNFKGNNDGLYTHAMLLSPNVPVIRADDSELLANPWHCAFSMRAAAKRVELGP